MTPKHCVLFFNFLFWLLKTPIHKCIPTFIYLYIYTHAYRSVGRRTYCFPAVRANSITLNSTRMQCYDNIIIVLFFCSVFKVYSSKKKKTDHLFIVYPIHFFFFKNIFINYYYCR